MPLLLDLRRLGRLGGLHERLHGRYDLSDDENAAPAGQRLCGGYSREGRRKSSKTAQFWTGKMLPCGLYDPIGIGFGSALDRPDNDRRDLITVQFAYAPDQTVDRTGAGLEDGRHLHRFLDLALPAGDGTAGRKDVDAGGEAFLDDRSPNPLRFG